MSLANSPEVPPTRVHCLFWKLLKKPSCAAREAREGFFGLFVLSCNREFQGLLKKISLRFCLIIFNKTGDQLVCLPH